MKHKLLIFITLLLSVNLYSQIDENYLEKESIRAKEDSSQLIHQKDSDKWLAEYIKETHAKLLQGNIVEKDYRASVCNNLDFEEGNFTGWTCQTGINYGYPAGSWTGSLPVANRHTIETGGTDPYGGFPKVAPGGGTYSVRLGNNGTGRQAERIIFSFIVGPTDTNFIYKYAVVFQDPNHPVVQQPYFELKILNSQNQVIHCGQQHYTAASNIPGFIYAGNDVWYKPWTTVGIRLADYVGQPVTVVVTNADCSLGAHFGYGYVDFICPQNMVAQAINFCEYDSSAILTVPNISPGATYVWSTGETTPTITINPQNFNDSTIQCYVTPPDVPTGCGFWYTFPINVNPLPIINVTSNPSIICYGESSLLSVNGANTYVWSHSLGSGITKTVSPTTTTTYSVTGTTIEGCTGTAEVTVTVHPLPNITATATPTEICLGESSNLMVSSDIPGTTFNWSNGLGTNSNLTVSPTTTATYSVTG
ncbi:MAG TPA: hypothetical protein PLA75_04980, partial [Bacteroidales bacterium]|nr:hypothetical protein [Bacteroidales bacterium]